MNPFPCSSLVPDLLTKLTTALEVRPNSAEKVPACTLNSCSAPTLTPLKARVVAALALGFGAVQSVALASAQAAGNAGVAVTAEDARHQHDEGCGAHQSAAGGQGQVLDHLCGHDPAEVRPLRFQQRRGGGHFHRLFDGADLEYQVQSFDSVNFHKEVGGLRFSEARLLGRHRVGAHLKVKQGVDAVGACGGRLADARPRMPGRYPRCRYNRTGLVGNRAIDCAPVLRAEKSRQEQEYGHNK